MAWLQFQLNQHGANLKVDGILGKKTLRAVARYQASVGLVADSLAGIKTISSLIGAAL